MENFLLGLFSGAILMLLRDLPGFIWRQPEVFWRVFIPVGGEGLAFAIFLVAFGSLWRFTKGDQAMMWTGNLMLGIGITLGTILLTALAIAMLVDYAKSGESQSGAETSNKKSTFKPYKPTWPLRRKR